jgi:flagellin
MSGIGAVGSYSSYSPYSVVASGGAIQSASQDAAGLAIEEKTKAQTGALDKGAENLKDAKAAQNISDGTMEGIADYLNSIKELAIKSQNGTLNDDDKQSIQSQIKQYLEGVEETVKQALYNEKPLLEDQGKLSVTTDGNGGKADVSTYDRSVKGLGLEGLDVTKPDFDMKTIDDAIKKVDSARANTGAESNRVDYATSYNTKASLELNGYGMDKEEDRTVKAIQDVKTQQVMDQYQMMLQKKQQEDAAHKSAVFFA